MINLKLGNKDLNYKTTCFALPKLSDALRKSITWTKPLIINRLKKKVMLYTKIKQKSLGSHRGSSHNLMKELFRPEYFFSFSLSNTFYECNRLHIR